MSRSTDNTKPIPRVTVRCLNRVLIGERIHDLRVERGWKALQLARATGIPRSTIAAIETGRMLPDPDRFLVLAAVFCISVDFLMTGRSSPVEAMHDGNEHTNEN